MLNPASGRCLNAPATNSALTLADCTDAANQQWKLPFSDSVTTTNPGNQSGIIGNAVSLQIQAASFEPQQTLTYSATGLPTGLSLDATSGLITGTPTVGGTSAVTVTVKDSTGAVGVASFSWAIIKGYGQITDSNGNCIDDSDYGTGNGNMIKVWSCNHYSAQQWTVNTNNTITVFGKCMTASNGGTTDGTLIVLYDCSAASSQVWQYQVNGTLLNPASGLCLNEPSASIGTQLTLADCTAVGTQQWWVPGTTAPNTVAVTNPGSETASVGTAVSVQIQATDSATQQTLTYSATGLPTGLSLNATTGLITGTPTAAGTSAVTVTVKDSTGAAGVTSFSWAIVKGYGQITDSNGNCIDDSDYGTSNGNPIKVWSCNHYSAQQWTVNVDNTITVFGKCMTASNGGTTDGTLIVLYDCSAASSQIWQYQVNGTLLNPASGLCLNEPSASIGTQLTLADCTGVGTQQWWVPGTTAPNTVAVTSPGSQTASVGTAVSVQIQATDSDTQQTLTYRATGLPAGLSLNATTGLITGTPTAAGTSAVTVTVKDSTGAAGVTSFSWAIVKGYGPITDSNGNCIDDSDYGTSNGNVIKVWSCNQHSAQQWTVNANNTITVFGKCMTASNGGTTDGTLIVLYDCSAASSQIWQPQANGTLLNPASGLCLNEPSASIGTQLTLATCTTATTQQWTLPISSSVATTSQDVRSSSMRLA